MRKTLIFLRIVQEKKRHLINGNCKDVIRTYRRFNPYNPLTYPFLTIGVVIAILAFGFIGAWDSVFDKRNPFKWID
jgi:hypothetical protein